VHLRPRRAEEYLRAMVRCRWGSSRPRRLIRKFITMQYKRNDVDFSRGKFRVRGDTIEIIPVYEEHAVRIELFGDEVEALYSLHPLTGDVLSKMDAVSIFPATHYAASPEAMHRAIASIKLELAERLAELEKQGKLLGSAAPADAHRLRHRDDGADRLLQRHRELLAAQSTAARPASRQTPCSTSSPTDFLVVIDESHATVPQIGAMTRATRARKRTLVEHGFRCRAPSTTGPLRWEEFLESRRAERSTCRRRPAGTRLGMSDGVVEQIIPAHRAGRPQIVVKSCKGQIDDLLDEIQDPRREGRAGASSPP
jgi:excinuclease ABC subunit B